MRTFRGRLRLFFALIVIVPMAAVALVAVVVADRMERASESAALGVGTRVAASLYPENTEGAELAAVDARRYAKRVEEHTGLHIAVFRGSTRLASTLAALQEPPATGPDEDSQRFEVDGRDYSGQITKLEADEGPPLTIVVFDRAGWLSEESGAGVLPVAGILLAGILLALGLSAFAVRENVNVHEHVERRGLTDEVTALGNRHALKATLSREANRWRRHRVPFGVVYLDIDDFKAVNEPPAGHAGGDAVLVAIARVLQDESRDTDVAFRPGGDEFVVVLPHTDIQLATAVANRLRQAVEGLVVQPAESEDRLRVTATLGVATIANGPPEDGPSPGDAVLRAANGALHRGKAKGKNRVQRA